MQKTYEETLLLRTVDCDFRGTWRPSAIFAAMQEVSGMHSQLLGCGRDTLMKQGFVWVLSRVELKMEKYPCAGDAVKVETFPTKNRRWFFPRYFILRDGQGGQIGCASTLWVLLDFAARKMAPPDPILHLIPDNSDLTAPMGLPAAVAEAGGEERVFTRQPSYTDLDVNDHVNNARYIDWLCDALGHEVLGRQVLGNICVNYDAEIRPEQAVELRLKRKDDVFSLSGFHGDKRHFEIGGTFSDRA